MPYETLEFPEWSWSHSRRRVFQECPRMYFYQYYGSHGGWEDQAPDVAKLAYRLKQLSSLPLELGDAVHSSAAFAIQSARSGVGVPTLDTLQTKVRNQLNQAYMESKGRAAWERQPRRRKMLQEFYYGTGLSDQSIKDAKERLELCLTNMLVCESFRQAVASPYVEVRELENFVTFPIQDTNIHAMPDLLYRLGDDTWTLTDWKTGQEKLDEEQMNVYALYVQERHGVRAENIKARIEWLGGGKANTLTFSEKELHKCKANILDSIESMRNYLTDATTNRPRGRGEFPLRDDTSMCRYCKFYQLCADEVASRASGPF